VDSDGIDRCITGEIGVDYQVESCWCT